MAKFKILSESTSEESFFDRQERIDWWDQKTLDRCKVFIAGAGALGNETIKNLTLLGVRKFLICDFDEISTSNLSRTVLFAPDDIGKRKAEVAADRCRELILSPDPQVEWIDCDLCWDVGLGLVAGCSIVLSCLDNVEARKSIAWAARKVNVPFVDSGITKLSGHVGVYPSDASACYSCNLSTRQQAAARYRYSCDDVKRTSVVEEKIPTVQIASAMISAWQCQEAIKLLMGQGGNQAFRLTFDGMTNTMSEFSLLQDRSCAELFHDRVNFTASSVCSDMRLAQALASLQMEFGTPVVIDLSGDRSFTKDVLCRRCGKEIKVNKPTHQLTEEDLYCDESSLCLNSEATLSEDTPTEKIQVSRFSLEDEDLLDLSLFELGIPRKHIITIDINGLYKAVQIDCGGSRSE